MSSVVGYPDLVAVATASLLLAIGLPGAVGIAILRHRLYDIQLLVRRTLVYGLLWARIVAAYLGLASALGLAASNRLPLWAAIVSTVVATAAFEPARRRLALVHRGLRRGRTRLP